MLASVGVSVSHDPESRPREHAARGRRRDVPGQGRRRQSAGAVRREPAPGSQTRTWRSRAGCATRCRGMSWCSPTSRSCRSRAGTPSAARRSCAGIPDGEERAGDRRPAPVDVPSAGRGERADRADRRLGAAHRLRAGGRVAARTGIAIPISVNVSARELTELDLAAARAQGAQRLPAAGTRAVPGGERGGRSARPRARPRGAERGQAPGRGDRAGQLRRRRSPPSACRETCRWTCSSSTAP